MTTSDTQTMEIPTNFLELIESYNHYKRLGFNTNQVELDAIHAAWSLKCVAFEQACVDNLITAEECQRGLQLIEVAYKTLADESARRKYDKELFRAQKKSKVVAVKPAEAFAARYLTESLLTSGRRAKLWVAIDQRLNRKVLIKELHPSLVRTEDQVKQFREECSFYAASNATHLVKVLDYDEQSFRVVMEWLPSHMGEVSRRQWAEQDRDYTPNEIREILRQCLRGLQVLHSRGWVHGRLSLGHLLLDDHGNVKLSITPGLRESSIAAVPSSDITHIAPEMLRPDIFGPVSPASDLYVLGFLMLELITRNRVMEFIDPASDEHRSEQEQWYRWHAAAMESLPTTAEWMHGMPEDIIRFVEALTNKQAGKRPVNATAALQLLEELNLAARPLGNGQFDTSNSESPNWADLSAEQMGAPPALHDAQFDDSSLTGWQSIKQATMDWLDANPQRKWIVLGSAASLAVCFVSFVITPEKNREKPVQLVQEKVEQEEPFDVVRAPRFPLEPVQDLAAKSPVSDRTAEKPAKDEGKVVSDTKPGRIVSIEVDGVRAGRVMVESKQSIAGKGNTWHLEPGHYTANIEYDRNQVLKRNFRVPAGEGPYTISIVLPDVVTSAPTRVETPEPIQLRPFRTDVPFDFVGVSPQDYERSERLSAISQNLIDYLEYDFGDDAREKPSLNTLDRRENRDPRLSTLLAICAYRENKLQVAAELCEESIKVIEQNELPFVLPYQLLIHIHDCQHETKKSVSLAAKSVKKRCEQYKADPTDDNRGLLMEQLWVFGKVAAHAVANTGKSIADQIDHVDYLEIVEINKKIPEDPLLQGHAEYASRTKQTRPVWMAESNRSSWGRTRGNTWGTYGSSSGDTTQSHAKGADESAKSDQSQFVAAPGRRLANHLQRRALTFDHSLSFLVERIRATLPPASKVKMLSKS